MNELATADQNINTLRHLFVTNLTRSSIILTAVTDDGAILSGVYDYVMRM